MACHGIHFALTSDQEAHLLSAVGDDDDLLDVVDAIEEIWDDGFLAETDSAWDAIHRCFCDGELLYVGGEYPLNHVICGGRQLITSDDTDFTVSYVSADKVLDVAQALSQVSHDDLYERYQQIDENDYGQLLSLDDFEYVWGWFCILVKFFAVAAKANRSVIFTVNC